MKKTLKTFCYATSVGAVEYTDCISADDKDLHQNECSEYETEPSYGEAPLPVPERRGWVNMMNRIWH